LEVDEMDEITREETQQGAGKFYVEDNKLKRTADGYGTVEVLPVAEGPRVAEEEHVACGHLGRDLMVTRIIQKYYWVSMRKDIDTAIATCPRCVQFGTRLQRLQLKPIVRFCLFDMLALDYLHMPKASSGKDIILVAIDCFTRYIMAWPMKGSPTSSAVVRCLTEIENRFTAPRELLMDNFFDNREIRNWAEPRSIKLTYSAPYAHVGLVENANHFVLERLRRLVNLDIHHVPMLEKATVPKKRPDELDRSVKVLNERKMTILGGFCPKDLLLGALISERQGEERPTVPTRLLMIEAIRSDASEAFVRNQARRLNKSKESNAWKPKEGDLALIYDASRDRSFDTGWKLRARWSGPYVVEAVRRRSAKVRTLDGRPKAGWVAWSLMKKWPRVREMDGRRTNDEEGDGDEGEEDEEDQGGRVTRSGRQTT
jgi:hypothetical protein